MRLSTINWKRGLLRLWAACSVVWIALAFYSENPIHKVVDETQRTITVNFEDGSTHIYKNAPLNTTPDQVEARAQKDFKKRVVHMDGGKPNHGYTDYSSATQFRTNSIWPPLFDFAKLAFIPPLLLLALGFTGLWIGRGLRR